MTAVELSSSALAAAGGCHAISGTYANHTSPTGTGGTRQEAHATGTTGTDGAGNDTASTASGTAGGGKERRRRAGGPQDGLRTSV